MIKVGTRNSPLALMQAEQGAQELVAPYRGKVKFELIPFSSPGDRDQESDLRTAPADFFTRDLDDAIRSGALDCAIHSAKDLPSPLADDIDFFFLPTREDHRDVLVCRVGELPENANVIGVSSDRRNSWAAKTYPAAVFKPVRGTIEKRLAQLDAGDFDLLLMAAAALNRLGLQHRITAYVPENELPPPEGQGALAVTFLKGNYGLRRLRQMFVYPVVLAGAGPGADSLLTLGAADAMRHCDICFYDALGLRRIEAYLRPGAKAVPVGKRLGGHTVKQAEINQMIADAARCGLRVLRLKGGDPGIFGRLAEEVETLSQLALPFRVIPGVSSLAAATTGTGLLPTRRGMSRGFLTATPRTAGSAGFMAFTEKEEDGLARIYFMSAAESAAICTAMIEEGMSKETPAAVVFDASMPTCRVITGTLSSLPEKVTDYAGRFDRPPPGIILIGSVFDAGHLYPSVGLLGGKRTLLTCSETLMPQAESAVRRYNGLPLPLPLITFRERAPSAELAHLKMFDWVIVSSPSSAEYLLKHVGDLRYLPKIMVCGSGTGAVFRAHGIVPDAEPEAHFGNAGLLELIASRILKQERVLRLRSDIASSAPTLALSRVGCEFVEVVFADTVPLTQSVLPEFDAIFFASSSAVKAFQIQFQDFVFTTQYVVVIGAPTAEAVRKVYPAIVPDRMIMPEESLTVDAFRAFAEVILCVENQ